MVSQCIFSLSILCGVLSVPSGVCDGLGHYMYFILDVAIQEVYCGEVR
jgi:hypothetical protein